jgi:hypothetical protein
MKDEYLSAANKSQKMACMPVYINLKVQLYGDR